MLASVSHKGFINRQHKSARGRGDPPCVEGYFYPDFRYCVFRLFSFPLLPFIGRL